MEISYNQIIYEVVQSHINHIETGRLDISTEDLISANKVEDLKTLTKQQKKLCNTLQDIQNSFSEQ